MRRFVLLLIAFCFSIEPASSDTCQECKFAVDLLHDAWGDKTTEECVGDLALFICDTFRIEDNFICQGITGDFSVRLSLFSSKNRNFSKCSKTRR
ncbi:hypothetical protein OESDEN_11132 [Oesophagostomum dentatum]|uniref:Saposin B-type domain-containing protein n=1 Tax=Oesophagostomum dentatum TaxID=61180 RepID=A0A0B1SZX3_OESDE|nr:hypothetical protein OESDEN_11132 [Oesophagostomum dentatum]